MPMFAVRAAKEKKKPCVILWREHAQRTDSMAPNQDSCAKIYSVQPKRTCAIEESNMVSFVGQHTAHRAGK